MKKLAELQQERAEAFEKMEAFTTLADTEKRELTKDEQTKWDEGLAIVEALDEQIERAEKQEALNKRFAKKAIETPEKKLSKRFDLFKGIREAAGGNLTGAELEVHQEGIAEYKRAGIEPTANALNIASIFMSKGEQRAPTYVATGDGTPPIKTDASDVLSIVRTPNVMDKLGVTFYNDLKGNFKIPKMGQLVATFVSEEAAVDSAAIVLGSDTLAPRRVGGAEMLTKELLSQTSQSVQNSIMQDFVDGIYRAVQKDLFDAVAAGATAIASHGTTDTAAVLAHSDILALEAAIENDFEGMAYACSHGQKALLKALALGTSIRFAWDSDNTINGYPAVATASLAATNGGMTNTCFDVIFGYWKAAVVGSWGGVELIVDPYTYALNGALQVTASGLFDTGVANALSFAAIRNATV